MPDAENEKEQMPAWAAELMTAFKASKDESEKLREQLMESNSRIQKLEKAASEAKEDEEEEYSDESYVPHFADVNPFCRRPTHVGNKPQQYDL